MNYNWYEDKRIDLERRLDDLEEQRAYLATDEARETIIEEFNDNPDSPHYRTLNAEEQNEYINAYIDAEQDQDMREMQEISDDLEVVRTVMSTWNEPAVFPPPPPAAGVDTSSRSVSTDSTFDEEGFDVGFINEYDEGAFTRVPMSRTDATIERLVERPRLRRSSAVRPVDLIWPEDDADTLPFVPDSPIGPPPGYEPGSPDSPPYAPSSPLDTPPFEPSSPIGTPRDNSIEISRDDVIMGPEIRLDESPEIIDLTTPSPPGSPERTLPPPPGSPERTLPPRTLRPPPAPSRRRRRRLIIRSGGKTKRKQKKGQTRKKVKRKSTKKRKGKSAKKTKKRK